MAEKEKKYYGGYEIDESLDKFDDSEIMKRRGTVNKGDKKIQQQRAKQQKAMNTAEITKGRKGKLNGNTRNKLMKEVEDRTSNGEFTNKYAAPVRTASGRANAFKERDSAIQGAMKDARSEVKINTAEAKVKNGAKKFKKSASQKAKGFVGDKKIDSMITGLETKMKKSPSIRGIRSAGWALKKGANDWAKAETFGAGAKALGKAGLKAAGRVASTPLGGAMIAAGAIGAASKVTRKAKLKADERAMKSREDEQKRREEIAKRKEELRLRRGY